MAAIAKQLAAEESAVACRRRAASERMLRMARARPPVRVADIIKEVCARTGLTLPDILSPRVQRPLCIARQEIWWKARQLTSLSYPRLGMIFNRDHASIVRGIRKHEQRMAGEGA